MARKKKPAVEAPLVPEPPRKLVHIWKAYGKLCFLSDAPQAGCGYTRVATIDVGRAFHHHVPSDGKGPSGLVFEGMTGENALPWSPSQVLTAARLQWFGFRLEAQ
jgi:hypothetical protein